MTTKKLSRVLDVPKKNQIRNNFRRVPDTDSRACFKESVWNMQQSPLATSHLVLGDSLVRVMQSLRTSWTTIGMAFRAATVAQL